MWTTRTSETNKRGAFVSADRRDNVAGTLVTLGETWFLRWALVSTTKGALHVRAVAKGRSPLYALSFCMMWWYAFCVGVWWVLFGVAALRHVDFYVAYSSTELPNATRVGTTPRVTKGVPANTCIRVCVLWGGSCEKQQHIFFKFPIKFPITFANVFQTHQKGCTMPALYVILSW